MLDLLVSSRPRHKSADKVANFLLLKTISPIITLMSFIELGAGLRSIYREPTSKVTMSDKYNLVNRFHTNPLAIDENFLSKYYEDIDTTLKAGDLILLLVAKKEDAILLTEDNQLLNESKRFGISAFTSDEFIKKYITN